MRNHFGKAFPLLLWKIDLHMRGVFPEEIEDLLAGSTNDVVNLVDLIEFVITWEQWAKRQDLVHDAADAPDVHFVAVVAVCQEALRSPVPTRGDVFGQRLILVQPPTTSQIRKFDRLSVEQNVFRLDVSVEDSVPVHVLDCLDQLVHVVLHSLLWQVVGPPLYCLVHVLLHQLENQGQSTRRLVIKDLNKLDDVRVRVQSLQGFDLSQIVNLVDAVEVALHAFYGNVLAIAEGLSLEDF